MNADQGDAGEPTASPEGGADLVPPCRDRHAVTFAAAMTGVVATESPVPSREAEITEYTVGGLAPRSADL